MAQPSQHGSNEAIEVVRRRAARARPAAQARWRRATANEAALRWDAQAAEVGRLTINFHPDRVAKDGRTVAEGMLADGRYRSQWATGISSGSRSAIAGGARHRFERALFGGAYDDADPARVEFPVYGAFDLLVDRHGGSPRFGSAFLVLHDHLRARTTLCAGDSHTGPDDVATFDEPWPVLAALAEQAARHRLLDRHLGVDSLLAALSGSLAPARPARSLDGYIEAQVHGGVALDRDVAMIVADPSHQFTDTGATSLRSPIDSTFPCAGTKGRSCTSTPYHRTSAARPCQRSPARSPHRGSSSTPPGSVAPPDSCPTTRPLRRATRPSPTCNSSSTCGTSCSPTGTTRRPPAEPHREHQPSVAERGPHARRATPPALRESGSQISRATLSVWAVTRHDR